MIIEGLKNAQPKIRDHALNGLEVGSTFIFERGNLWTYAVDAALRHGVDSVLMMLLQHARPGDLVIPFSVWLWRCKRKIVSSEDITTYLFKDQVQGKDIDLLPGVARNGKPDVFRCQLTGMTMMILAAWVSLGAFGDHAISHRWVSSVLAKTTPFGIVQTLVRVALQAAYQEDRLWALDICDVLKETASFEQGLVQLKTINVTAMCRDFITVGIEKQWSEREWRRLIRCFNGSINTEILSIASESRSLCGNGWATMVFRVLYETPDVPFRQLFTNGVKYVPFGSTLELLESQKMVIDEAIALWIRQRRARVDARLLLNLATLYAKLVLADNQNRFEHCFAKSAFAQTVYRIKRPSLWKKVKIMCRVEIGRAIRRARSDEERTKETGSLLLFDRFCGNFDAFWSMQRHRQGLHAPRLKRTVKTLFLVNYRNCHKSRCPFLPQEVLMLVCNHFTAIDFPT